MVLTLLAKEKTFSLLALEVDDVLVEDVLALVEVLYEGGDAALVAEVALPLGSLLAKGDGDTAVQEGEFAEAGGDCVEVELGGLEDFGIRLEGHGGACGSRLADDLKLAGGLTTLVALVVDLAIAPDLDTEPLAESVDDGDAHAVKAAGNLV